MAIIELVYFNTIYSTAKKEVKKASTRRGKSKKADETVAETPAAESTESTDTTEASE
jgi:large subunit ribosomal protein L17